MEYAEVHTNIGSWDIRIESISKVKVKKDGTIIIWMDGGVVLDCTDTYEYIRWYLVRNNRRRLNIRGED